MTLKKRNERTANPFKDEVPPGAKRKAFDREDNGGGPPGSPLGDRHAIGDTSGGDETGGLAGSNVGEGAPVNDEDLEQAEEEDRKGPFAGSAGGAVGGTPAEGRASGGHVRGGFSPGSGSSRGDSTVGSGPKSGTKNGASQKKPRKKK